jgi:hypothetical protein
LEGCCWQPTEVSITVCEGESEGEGLVNGRDAAVCVQMTRCREDFSRGVSFSLGCAQCSNLSLLLSNAAAAINLPRKIVKAKITKGSKAKILTSIARI